MSLGVRSWRLAGFVAGEPFLILLPVMVRMNNGRQLVAGD
jgi:hypothetical protein